LYTLNYIKKCFQKFSLFLYNFSQCKGNHGTVEYELVANGLCHPPRQWPTDMAGSPQSQFQPHFRFRLLLPRTLLPITWSEQSPLFATPPQPRPQGPVGYFIFGPESIRMLICMQIFVNWMRLFWASVFSIQHPLTSNQYPVSVSGPLSHALCLFVCLSFITKPEIN